MHYDDFHPTLSKIANKLTVTTLAEPISVVI